MAKTGFKFHRQPQSAMLNFALMFHTHHNALINSAPHISARFRAPHISTPMTALMILRFLNWDQVWDHVSGLRFLVKQKARLVIRVKHERKHNFSHIGCRCIYPQVYWVNTFSLQNQLRTCSWHHCYKWCPQKFNQGSHHWNLAVLHIIQNLISKIYSCAELEQEQP